MNAHCIFYSMLNFIFVEEVDKRTLSDLTANKSYRLGCLFDGLHNLKHINSNRINVILKTKIYLDLDANLFYLWNSLAKTKFIRIGCLFYGYLK